VIGGVIGGCAGPHARPASVPSGPGPEILAPRRTRVLANRVVLDLPRAWYPEAAYRTNADFHSMSAKTEGSTRTWLLVNTSGVALQPVQVTIGNLDVLGIEQIEARFGAVDAGAASVVATGEVLLQEGESRRQGPRAEWRNGEWRVLSDGG
jgi:hypothetical protein